MKLLSPAHHSQLTSLTDILDALVVSTDPALFLPALMTHNEHAAHRVFLEISVRDLPTSAYRIRRMTFPNRSAPVEGNDSPCEGGVIPDLIRVPSPKLARELDLSAETGLPPLLRGFRSGVFLPIRGEGGFFDWVVLLDDRPEAFSLSEMEELIIRARLVAVTQENLEVAQRLCEANLKVKREIDEIAMLQRSLLPEDFPEIPGMKISAGYEALSQAGGDFYDFMELENGRWGILIGDVSGHGPAAAVVMAMLHAIVRTYPGSPDNPAQVLAYANKQLCDKNIRGAFATSILMFYDPSSRAMTWCRAGHPPAILTEWKNPPEHRQLEENGDLPLGIDANAEYSNNTIELKEGQTLVLYTDGVTEARNAGGKQLDLSGLEMAINGGEGDAARIIENVQETLEWHTRQSTAEDDRTMLAMEIVKSGR
jgi:phosphoserine phosphatase RsbU/P